MYNKKKNLIPIVYEVTTEHIEIQRPMTYSYHICGDTRHKIINCPKYSDM
jgi:hypothetical protein